MAELDHHVRQGLKGLEVQALPHLRVRIRNAQELRGEVPHGDRVAWAKSGTQSREVEPSNGSMGLQQRVGREMRRRPQRTELLAVHTCTDS